jgi:predicted DNA-binding protein
MQPELYDRLYAHCKELDIPVTVFVREAISRALPPEGSDCGWAVLRPDHGHAAVDP